MTRPATAASCARRRHRHGIVEHKDATEAERRIREINSGIYAFDAAQLRDALRSVTTENAQGEMYLTDVLGIARSQGGRVAASFRKTAGRWRARTTASSSPPSVRNSTGASWTGG
jgi:bifunctional N-acetylglucosamine-1-phosphate-uridyltransferase/glucosamine-1-phosphate-acetyltransferase GlmU-like protein